MTNFSHPQHQADQGTKRYWCNSTHPKPIDAPTWTRWRHERVIETGDQEDGYPSGDIVQYQCLDCQVTWKAELPQ